MVLTHGCLFPEASGHSLNCPIKCMIHWMRNANNLTALQQQQKKNVSTRPVRVPKIDVKISFASQQFSLISSVFSLRAAEKLYSSHVPPKTVGKKVIFDFPSFGISSSPTVLSDIKANLQVMANRSANLSKPALFESLDTDACVTLQEGRCQRAPVVSTSAHHNARCASFRRVMTDHFSALGQNKHQPRREILPQPDDPRTNHPPPPPLIDHLIQIHSSPAGLCLPSS